MCFGRDVLFIIYFGCFECVFVLVGFGEARSDGDSRHILSFQRAHT